jgi:hypothetical protein
VSDKPMISVARLGVTGTPALECETSELDDQLAVNAHRERNQCMKTVPRQFARLLNLDPEVVMLERVITLFIDNEPILTSNSYLPVELVDDSKDWHEVEIGQLAVANHTVVPAEFIESWSRWPTSAERKLFNIPKGADRPVNLYTQTHQVSVDGRQLPAGVIVLARGDRVVLRWGAEYQGLLLVG